MSKLTYKASYYALYAMFAIILIVIGLFFFGGNATGDAVIVGVDPEMWQPAQTDALLYLMYVLFGVAIAATVLGAIHSECTLQSTSLPSAISPFTSAT